MKTFIQDALQTKSPTTNDLVIRLNDLAVIDLLHAAMGMETEVGEFMDQLKKHIFYGKELDRVNLREELGDLLWYIALAMSQLDTDFEKEMERVINKLQTRYPHKFTKAAALDRNLDEERKVLEGT